ncbi:MAG: ATP-binding cassette domain-containing protein [Actinobacteria bacterium]|nr:ATP-binding cassette domain-containing protein [Actinomycetota bacterium]
MSAAISARGLVRRFGETLAVAGVDLSVATGEIFGFLGPNGAGKSTAVRMLTTLLSPTEGSAEVAGFDVERETEQVRLRIGVALQESALDPKQTGREILDLQGRLYGLDAPVRAARIAELLELVDIGDAIDRMVATYSGGMKRRLDLAAALVHRPEIVFLDEPTTGLDPVSRSMVWDEVRKLNRESSTTIFLTTQYLEEADSLCDRVAIIAKGRIVAQGSPTELKRSIGADVIIARVAPDDVTRATAALRAVPELGHVEATGDSIVVGVSNGGTAISPVAVALSGANVHVIELTMRTPTLDDVFLETTGARMRDEEEGALR